MKNLKLIIVCVSLFFSFNALPKKILKVKGKKVYFSRKGLKAKKGQIFRVYDGGYKVGKVKVTSLKGKFGIARLISGDANRGDQLKGSRKSKRSSKKSRRGSRNWGPAVYIGGGIVMPSSTEQLEFGSLMVGSLGFDLPIELFNKKLILMLSANKSLSGSVTVLNENIDPDNPEWSSSMLMVNSDVAYPFADMFYGKLGLGITSFSYEGEILPHGTPNPTTGLEDPIRGLYKDSFLGLNLGIGAGVKVDIGSSFAVKVDLSYRFSNFFSASSDSPDGSSEAEAGMIPHLNALVYVGYKF